MFVMIEERDFLCTAEASRLLGVGIRQVRRLVTTGAITQVGTIGRVKLLDARSVQRLKLQKTERGRPWTQATFELVLEFLSKGDTHLGTTIGRSRTRKRLGSKQSLADATTQEA